VNQDDEHLQLLAVFHYVVAGLAAVFALFPIFHLIIGLMMVLAPDKLGTAGAPVPAMLGWFFVIFAATIIIMGWGFAVLVFTAGRFLARRKHHTFCVAMAAVECIFMPFGTVLGVFTMIVLMRESVKQRFSVTSSLPPPPVAAAAGSG